MVLLDFHWSQLLQPQWWLGWGGIWIVLFIVFAETGLFVGFFLPGDSLLFVAGVAWEDMQSSAFNLPFFVIMLLITLCAIVGNTVGYWFGRRIGPAMYQWKDRWFFKQRYLQQAKEFYEKNGGGAIFLARFVPFVRTFAPIVAGIVKMEPKKFSFYSTVSAFAWVFSMMLLGKYLHKFLLNRFNYDLRHDLEWIVLGIVLVTTLPVIIKVIGGRKKKDSQTPTSDTKA
jgi:membrane-associated protein